MSMLRVALSDLRSSYRNWVGTLIVITVAAFFLSIAIAGSQTASETPGHMGKLLSSFTTPSAALTILSALFTVNTVSVLAVVGQRRNHALWQLVGFLPWQVSLIVIVQVFSVTLIGTLAGTSLGAVAVQNAFNAVFAINTAYTAPPILFVFGTWLWTGAFMFAAVSLGGLHAGYRSGRTRLIEVLGRSAERFPSFGKVRWIFLALTASGTALVGLFLANPTSNDLSGAITIMVPLGILFACLLTVTVSVAAPKIFPILLRTWTAIVPAHTSSTAWHLARATSRARVTRSSSAITPLMIAAALSSSLFTVFMMAESAQTAAGVIDGSRSTINTPSIFTVLASPLAICAVAVTVVVYMTSRARERENALVLASGGTARIIMVSAALEGLIYVGTAAITGLLISTILSAVMLVGLLPIAPDTQLRVGFGHALATLTVGLVLIVTAVVIPSLSALRLNVSRVLSTE